MNAPLAALPFDFSCVDILVWRAHGLRNGEEVGCGDF